MEAGRLLTDIPGGGNYVRLVADDDGFVDWGALSPLRGPRGRYKPPSKAYTIRVREDAVVVFEWWCGYLGLPPRSVLRAAVEDVAMEIVKRYDPDPPGTDVSLDDLRTLVHQRAQLGTNQGLLQTDAPTRT